MVLPVPVPRFVFVIGRTATWLSKVWPIKGRERQAETGGEGERSWQGESGAGVGGGGWGVGKGS